MTAEQLQELRTQAAEAIAAGKAKAEMMIEVSRLIATINLNNDNVVAARVQARLKTEATDKLNLLDTACSEIVASMPIYSARTKENRKWNPSKQYGMGNQIALLTGLLSGIQYAAFEHKAQMLALTGLSEDLIEDTLAAFGNTAYYSSNYNVVVDATPANPTALASYLLLVEDALGVTLDKASVNPTSVAHRFTAARLKAETKKAEVDAALAMPRITIE